MLNEFILLSIAHIFAVASPGADFAVVLKNTLNSGRKAGVMTAIGVGFGISIHMIYTLFGMALIIAQSEILFTLVQWVGAGYLLWLAWQGFQSRARQAGEHKSTLQVTLKSMQAFRQGFLTNVFNPKATAFFLFLFTNLVNPDTPFTIQSLYGLWLVFYTMLWFSFVAWIFSRQRVLAWYETHGHYFDWAMGVVLVIIALRMIF